MTNVNEIIMVSLNIRWMNEEARNGGWNVNITNVTDEMGCLSVAGPRSKELLAKLDETFTKKFPFFSAKKVSIKL